MTAPGRHRAIPPHPDPWYRRQDLHQLGTTAIRHANYAYFPASMVLAGTVLMDWLPTPATIMLTGIMHALALIMLGLIGILVIAQAHRDDVPAELMVIDVEPAELPAAEPVAVLPVAVSVAELEAAEPAADVWADVPPPVPSRTGPLPIIVTYTAAPATDCTGIPL